MRIAIGGHVVEGTVEEVAALLKVVGVFADENSSAPAPVQANGAAAQNQRSGHSPFVTEDFAYEVLTRRPLDQKYIALLNKLKASGSAWTSALDLQKTLKLSTREFAGLLGAFGRRVSHTEGATSRYFFDQYWDAGKGFNLYRLPDSVRAAMQRAGL